MFQSQSFDGSILAPVKFILRRRRLRLMHQLKQLHPGARPALYQYRQYLKRCCRFVGKSREGMRSGDWGSSSAWKPLYGFRETFFRRKNGALMSRRDGTFVARQFIAWIKFNRESVP